MANDMHQIQFNVNIDSSKGVVTYLDSIFNGEKTILIPAGSNKTVSNASEAIRMTIMDHKKNRYSRY